MAAVETELRELSPIVAHICLCNGYDFPYDEEGFFEVLDSAWQNGLVSGYDGTHFSFPSKAQSILENGYRAGTEIYNRFDIEDIWYEHCGATTADKQPWDIIIGGYRFSLKDNSNIVKNMGMKNFFSTLTEFTVDTPIHIFEEYAFDAYSECFHYCYSKFVSTVKENGEIELYDKDVLKSVVSEDVATGGLEAYLVDNKKYYSLPSECWLPEELQEYSGGTKEFVKNTIGRFVGSYLSDDETYRAMTYAYAIEAGDGFLTELIDNFAQDEVSTIIGCCDLDYWYLKTTSKKLELYYVPSVSDAARCFAVDTSRIEISIPECQLNIKIPVVNIYTGKELDILVECRFSHCPFSGIPEAKVKKGATTYAELFSFDL